MHIDTRNPPRRYKVDVTEIADALRARQVAIVNLQGADRSLLQRVVDFTSGVAYTIDGRIQKLAEAIYLIVPAGVTVNSAASSKRVTPNRCMNRLITQNDSTGFDQK